MREGPRGSSFVQWKRIFVPCLFCCWALGSRERRGQFASILILHLFWCKTQLWESKGRQCICCSHPLFRGSESTRECRLLPTCPVCHCATLVVLRALLWARGQPPKWGTQWGSSSIHDWARGQLFHVKKSWGTSGDAPALASCWGTLVLRAGIRSKLQASRFRSSGGLNNLCWHCCALLDGIFQSLLSPKYKSWIQAVAWCSHPLQPNRHFGLDAPVAQWEQWKLQLIY